jgi:hypothetical protein
MANQKRANLKKQDEVESKHRSKQQEPESSFDQFHAWEPDMFSIAETPFVPRTDEHAELLAMSPSDEARANIVLQLQQAYGNRYVQRLLKSNVVQAKLTVNAPGDIYEQEADRIADEVTSAEKSQVQRQEEEEEEEEEEVQAQRQEEEEELQAQRQPVEEEEEEEVQAQSAEGQPDTVSESIEARIGNARGSGHPLSESVREPMEQAFGADFSDVRVHTDSEANLLNQQLSAKAFTTARDIFFRQGEYSPGSGTGKKLIAHELTHVVQQEGNKSLKRRAKVNEEELQMNDVPISIQRMKGFDKDQDQILEPWDGGHVISVRTDADNPVGAYVTEDALGVLGKKRTTKEQEESIEAHKAKEIPFEGSFWCHGYSLGTFGRFGYSVFSGALHMGQVINDEYKELGDLNDGTNVQPGDLAVWYSGGTFQHSAVVVELVLDKDGKTVNIEDTTVDSKTGRDVLEKNWPLSKVMDTYDKRGAGRDVRFYR